MQYLNTVSYRHPAWKTYVATDVYFATPELMHLNGKAKNNSRIYHYEIKRMSTKYTRQFDSWGNF